MRAEIITTGNELLLGQVTDVNSHYLAQQLNQAGLAVYRMTTVGDNELQIADVVRGALRRSDVVLVIGGTGPGADDKTREAVATATNRKVVLNRAVLRRIQQIHGGRQSALPEEMRRLAYTPRNVVLLSNPVGLMPGLVIRHQNSYVMVLPGTPEEVQALTQEAVLPFLRRELALRGQIKTRVLRTAGMSEWEIETQIANLSVEPSLSLALAPYPGGVDIRLVAKAVQERVAQRLIEDLEARLRARLGDAIYGVDQVTLEEVVIQLLQTRQQRLTVLETLTGGLLAGRLTAIPAGMAVLDQAWVTSVDRARDWFLAPDEKAGFPTGPLAEALTAQVRRQAQVEVALAVLGETMVEPGRTPEVYLVLNTAESSMHQVVSAGDRSELTRVRVVNQALDFLRRQLSG